MCHTKMGHELRGDGYGDDYDKDDDDGDNEWWWNKHLAQD